MRVASFERITRRCAGDSACDESTSNLTVTRVETLFTFSPPGPLLWDMWNSISFSGIDKPLPIEIKWTSSHGSKINVVGQLIHIGRGIIWEMNRQLLANNFNGGDQTF